MEERDHDDPLVLVQGEDRIGEAPQHGAAHLLVDDRIARRAALDRRKRRVQHPQDLQSFFWTEEEVNQRLACILSRAAEVWAAAESYKTDLRTAAYAVGVARVSEAIRLRGIYP